MTNQTPLFVLIAIDPRIEQKSKYKISEHIRTLNARSITCLFPKCFHVVDTLFLMWRNYMQSFTSPSKTDRRSQYTITHIFYNEVKGHHHCPLLQLSPWRWAPWGPTKKNMGPEKGKNKEAILSKNDDFGRLSKFPCLFLRGCIFRKINWFYLVPWLPKKSEDQSGGPSTNLKVFGDEVSFQYFQKT